MKISRRTSLVLCGSVLLTLAFNPATLGGAELAGGATRILLVTGGHDYEQGPFLEMFRSFDGVTFEHVMHPQAQARFAPEAAKAYDVVVMYDMYQKIDDATKANFEALLKQGKGLVVLHHAIANYNNWDRYAEIIGAKYYLQPMTVDGVQKARSLWKHDVEFRVQIATPDHPVTRGVRDFDIHDETYNLFDVQPGVTPLLTTTEATSGKTIGWAKTIGASRLVFIQLGHDHLAYENPNYRKLVRQAIQWTARKLN